MVGTVSLGLGEDAQAHLFLQLGALLVRHEDAALACGDARLCVVAANVLDGLPRAAHRVAHVVPGTLEGSGVLAHLRHARRRRGGQRVGGHLRRVLGAALLFQ